MVTRAIGLLGLVSGVLTIADMFLRVPKQEGHEAEKAPAASLYLSKARFTVTLSPPGAVHQSGKTQSAGHPGLPNGECPRSKSAPCKQKIRELHT